MSRPRSLDRGNARALTVVLEIESEVLERRHFEDFRDAAVIQNPDRASMYESRRTVRVHEMILAVGGGAIALGSLTGPGLRAS